MTLRIPLVPWCFAFVLLSAPPSLARGQSIKPILDALGLSPTELAAVVGQGAWSSLPPDEWGNQRYLGVVFGQRLELTAYVADGQLLQVELRGPGRDGFAGGTSTFGAIRDSLDAIYGPHTGVSAPWIWTIPRANNAADTIEIRRGIHAYVPGATSRLMVAKLMRSGIEWSCVERRIGGLSLLPQDQQAYHDSVLSIAMGLRARGATFEMLRRASCGRIQVGDLRDAVALAYGRPDRAAESRDARGSLETWYYDAKRTVVTILNGTVSEIALHP